MVSIHPQRDRLDDVSGQTVAKVTPEVVTEKGDEDPCDGTAAGECDPVSCEQVGSDRQERRAERTQDDSESGGDAAGRADLEIPSVCGDETDEKARAEQADEPSDDPDQRDRTAERHPDDGEQERPEKHLDREQATDAASRAGESATARP